jgi:uncharacterized protein YdhG (YjbR/CyaY superfamily)
MAKTDFQSVDEYIAAQPETVREVLERVRSAIRQALPDAEEIISYQIPAFKLHGGSCSISLGGGGTTRSIPRTISWSRLSRDELAPYKVNKATIRFPLSQPVPVRLIGRIAKFRAKEAGRRAKAKPAKPRKP